MAGKSIAFKKVEFLYNDKRGSLTILGIAHYAQVSVRRVKLLIAQIERAKAQNAASFSAWMDEQTDCYIEHVNNQADKLRFNLDGAL